MDQPRIAVITGGAGLLGQSHTEALLELGVKVYVSDINLKKAKRFCENINKKKYLGEALPLQLDVTNEKSIDQAIKKIKRIDILVNNAALNPTLKSLKRDKKTRKFNLHNINFASYQKELDVGLTGYLKCTVKFGNMMAKNKQGVILNIASDLSVISPNQNLYNKDNSKVFEYYKPASYSIIKHGVIGLTKYFATFWAKDNIRVNSLSPGGVYDNQNKNFLKKLKKLIPMSRMAEKNEYKSIVQFLCSDGSRYMTGQNIVMDGGRSIW